MKHIKKILALFLAVLLLLSLLVSCKKDEEGEAVTGGEETAVGVASVSGNGSDTAGNSDTEEVWETDENGYVLDNLGTVDLGGREINILTGSGRMKECYVASDDIGTQIKAAVFARNQTVQLRTKCKLNFISETDGYNYSADYASKAMSLSSTGEVDLFAVYSLTANTLMVNGVLTDLAANDIIEFEKPWWNAYMVDGCSVHGRMYVCSGDISYQLTGSSHGLLYNKELSVSSGVDAWVSATYDQEDLYELVKAGDWTLDKMIALCKQVSVDEDGVKNANDTFGYTAAQSGPDSFWAGSGLRHLETGADGSVIISDDMSSQKASNLSATLVEFLKTPATCVPDTVGAAADGTTGESMFKKGQALFWNAPIDQLILNWNFDIGVIPVPKYDADQTTYMTGPGFGYSMWGMARSAEGYEDLCCVLECMASESYRQTVPAFFDTTLVGRQETANDYAMLQIIRAGAVIDGGRVLDSIFDGRTWGIFRDVIKRGEDYLSFYGGYAEALQAQAISLNNIILNMEKLYG